MSQRHATRADLRAMAENTVRVGHHLPVGMTLAVLLLRDEAGDPEATAFIDALLARVVVVDGRLRERGLQ